MTGPSDNTARVRSRDAKTPLALKLALPLSRRAERHSSMQLELSELSMTYNDADQPGCS